MPLLDHFHPPLDEQYEWSALHSNWATRLADSLNDRWLPERFLAVENMQRGTAIEIDVAVLEQADPRSLMTNGAATALPSPQTWTAPSPVAATSAHFPDDFEVLIFRNEGGRRLVGAVEIINPSNKDRPAHRRAFAVKCASYLYQGISLAIVDIVTSRRANLHNEIMALMESAEETNLVPAVQLYAVAYRPVIRAEKPEIDLWPTALTLGTPLPTLPLQLTADLCVPIDFESTYMEACRRRRLQ